MARDEQILEATIQGRLYTAPGESRIEALLKELNQLIISGGGGGGFTPTTEQLAAMNSGITLTDVAQITANKNDISDIQTTIGNINSVLEEVL